MGKPLVVADSVTDDALARILARSLVKAHGRRGATAVNDEIARRMIDVMNFIWVPYDQKNQY